MRVRKKKTLSDTELHTLTMQKMLKLYEKYWIVHGGPKLCVENVKGR